MIRDLTLGKDEAGFPIVSWTELRGFSGCGGPGPVQMQCRIGKEPLSGALMLLSRRLSPEGPVDEGKLWHGLQGFSVGSPHMRSRARLEQELIEYLKRKSASLRVIFGDSAMALQADFGREGLLEVSHSESSAAELDHLVVLLTQSFVVARDGLVNSLCEEMFRWPLSDKRLPDFSPGASALKATAEALPKPSPRLNALFALLAAGLLGYLLYLGLLVLKIIKP